MSYKMSRRQFLGSSLAAATITCTSAVWARTQKLTQLPIPPLLDGSTGDPVNLQIREGSWSFIEGVQTPTFGINQEYLGPTIRTRKNSNLNLHYQNNLSEGVSIHGHGLHVPGDVDGGPQLEIPPGEIWHPSLSIVQPAATCWYHSHTHGRTGYQVYHGLAGMMIIDDELSDALPLPKNYGVDDLPIIIQDRTLDAQGRLVYSLNEAGEDGWYGETVIINGAMNTFANVPAGKVRLRILNGANARFYIITFKDNRTFHKIASDGGFLESPVTMSTMEMAPGERCEIIVDLSDGKPAELMTLFEDDFDEDGLGIITDVSRLFFASEKSQPQASLTLKVDTGLIPFPSAIPDKLATIDRPAEKDITRTRDFMLTMPTGKAHNTHQAHSGHHSGHHSGYHSGYRGHNAMNMTVNGAVMDMNVINERVQAGMWERWRVRSNVGAHPFHIHGCSFLIEEMEGVVAPPEQRGWKDVVVTDDDDWSSVLVRFDHLATEEFPYMYHCHILEHEDHGMMGQFTVKK